ncbi:hypothetical protein N8T08_001278 [Aspergillus melleus]|uniref:Uncharacterized protein n=1 Tax=Aspergillus melleus TaxID=138277 RepID=A0ACC3AP19_9EURO|nr:hypothetical protein N8T08_001278 [Aspergillus melleus]
MDTPLSTERISTIFSSARSPSDLYETLAQYEGDALLLASSKQRNNSDLLPFFYSTFFFAHLLSDQIYEARAMTQRMPPNLSQNDPSLQNCLVLLRAVWQREYEQVYKILRQLPWPEPLKPMVNSFETHFQEKTLREVRGAYEAIRPAAAASYLGLDPDAAEKGDPAIIQKLTASGWTWDESTMLLHPKPLPTAPETDRDLQNGLGQIMALIAKHAS